MFLTVSVLNTLNIFPELRYQRTERKNIICTMDDVRGDVLGPPHGTTFLSIFGKLTFFIAKFYHGKVLIKSVYRRFMFICEPIFNLFSFAKLFTPFRKQQEDIFLLS